MSENSKNNNSGDSGESKSIDNRQKESWESKINKIVTDPNKYFYLSDGRRLTSIKELLLFLLETNDQEFHNYVSESKNDFANWLRGVIGEEELADYLSKVNDREESAAIICEYFLSTVNSEEDLESLRKIAEKYGEVLKRAVEKDPKLFEIIRELRSKKDDERTNILENESKRSYETIAHSEEFFDDGSEKESVKEKYEEEFNELKKSIEEERKKGKSTLFADLKMKWFRPKLDYALSTGLKEDFHIVDDLLSEIKKELEEIRAEEPPETWVSELTVDKILGNDTDLMKNNE